MVINGSVTQHATSHCHTVEHNNKTHLLNCGGECVEECGVCDPEYDGCFGTKYCKKFCEDGTVCDHDLKQPAGCEGFCDYDFVCKPVPHLLCTSDEVVESRTLGV